MNTDRMGTSAVYGLFEELKQSLTEMTTSLKGRSEQQTIDLSKIEELFGKMNTLSNQEVFSPEQIRVLEDNESRTVIRKEHIFSLDFENRKRQSLFSVWGLFFCFLWLETSGKCDKTVNYRIMT